MWFPGDAGSGGRPFSSFQCPRQVITDSFFYVFPPTRPAERDQDGMESNRNGPEVRQAGRSHGGPRDADQGRLRRPLGGELPGSAAVDGTLTFADLVQLAGVTHTSAAVVVAPRPTRCSAGDVARMLEAAPRSASGGAP